MTLLALAEIAIGFLAYTNREEVSRNELRLKPDVLVSELVVPPKVGLRIAEFYTTMYSLYAATSDPAVAVTLLFVNNLVRLASASSATSLTVQSFVN